MKLFLSTILILFLPLSLCGGENFSVELGPQRTVLAVGSDGLSFFPDQPITVIGNAPLTFLLTANNGRINGTFVMKGDSFSSARLAGTFLEPVSGTFDNGYAGCGAAFLNKQSNEWVCLYHAEDHEGGKPVPYNKALRSTYWSIGMASVDGKTNKVTRHGRVLMGETKKEEIKDDHRGIGDVSVAPDQTGKFLYAYYTDLNRKARVPATICMSRTPLSSNGRPGTWKKFFDGDFKQDGLGGKESPVVELPGGPDVIGPHVSYVSELKRYFMVCNVVYFSDIQQVVSERSGIYWTHSADGLRWEPPSKLVIGQSVPQIGKNYTGHPTLIVEKSDATSLTGQLLYCFSPSWGTAAPHSPHFLAGRSFSLRLSKD